MSTEQKLIQLNNCLTSHLEAEDVNKLLDITQTIIQTNFVIGNLPNNHMCSSILALPDDIISPICVELNLEGYNLLSSTCKHYNDLLKNNYVWKSLFEKNFYTYMLPAEFKSWYEFYIHVHKEYRKLETKAKGYYFRDSKLQINEHVWNKENNSYIRPTTFVNNVKRINLVKTILSNGGRAGDIVDTSYDEEESDPEEWGNLKLLTNINNKCTISDIHMREIEFIAEYPLLYYSEYNGDFDRVSQIDLNTWKKSNNYKQTSK